MSLCNFTPTNKKKLRVLSPILTKARSMNTINANLMPFLPQMFQKNLRLINIDDDIAIFACSSSAIAFRAKYQQELLLGLLLKVFKNKKIKKVVFKVL